MKRAFAVFLLCLVLAAGAAVLAARSVQVTGDQVTVSARRQQGDPAAAQGLTAQQSVVPSSSLAAQAKRLPLWDLTIPLDRPAGTQVLLSPQGELPPVCNTSAGITFSLDPAETFYSGTAGTFLGMLVSENSLRGALLFPLYEYAVQQTQPGETHTETLDPRDFLDRYPIQAYLSLPRESSLSPYNLISRVDDSPGAPFQQALWDFFSFPLPEDTRWTVTVTKNQKDRLTALSLAGGSGDLELETRSAVGDDTLYFTLAPPDADFPAGVLPSFERVPGGYGIYRLDYTTDEGGTAWPDPQSLGLVYSLDPTAGTVTSLTLSPDEATLFLVVYAEGAYTCSALDTQTMTCRQTFSIPSEDLSPAALADLALPTDVCPTLVLGEDCLLALGAETLHLFSQAADGSYQFRWSVPRPEGICPTQWTEQNLRGAWNGEKLALGVYDNALRQPGLDLWIYGGAGDLLYRGSYTTSLNQGEGDTSVQIVANRPRALTLRWET